MKPYRIYTEFVDLGLHKVVIECSSVEQANAVKSLVEIALTEEDIENEQEAISAFRAQFETKHYGNE